MSKGNMKPFSLKTDMFVKTDGPKQFPVVFLPIDKLRKFHDHPFRPYSGERFNELVESIKSRGVLMPVIVRPLDDSLYEILSGHNRVGAAIEASLIEVPCIVKENISDEEALLIVTETNLLQRSFSDMTHSERAISLSAHFEAIKKQGRRNDLVHEVEAIVNADSTLNNATYNPVGWESGRYSSYKVLEAEHGLSQTSIIRYVRLSKLHHTLLTRLDEDGLSIRAAVALSYLTYEEQLLVSELIDTAGAKVSMKQAEALRELSNEGLFTRASALKIMQSGGNKKENDAMASVKINRTVISEFFSHGESKEEIACTVEKALKYYFTHSKRSDV